MDREAIIVEMVSLLLNSNTRLQVVLGRLVPHPHPMFLGQAGKDRATRLKVQAAAQTIKPAPPPPLTNNIQVLAVVEELAEARLTALPKEAPLTNNLRHHLHLPILHSRPSPPLTELGVPHLTSRIRLLEVNVEGFLMSELDNSPSKI